MNNGMIIMNTSTPIQRYWLMLLLPLLLTACQIPPQRSARNMEAITTALNDTNAADRARQSVDTPPEVAAALLPPLQRGISDVIPVPESRFDISVNATPAHEFFMSLVKGTGLNMVVHPDVSGDISISLRNVTLDEVMETVRDVYDYRYRRSANTYQVFPARMRTQIFNIDYLHIVRNGDSRTMVSSGQISQNNIPGSSGQGNTTTAGNGGGSDGSNLGEASGSVVQTTSRSDFWQDLEESLQMIVGEELGRKVVVHPQTGLIVVHAMPEELRDVGEFLTSIEDVSHRLVIIEAKIIEVTLNDKFQAGINWNALIEIGTEKSILFGHNGGGSVFDTGDSGLSGALTPIGKAAKTALFPTESLGGLFTVNADLKDFNALIELLKTQGDVQVLSSPRISTVNNQKAVIKVGQDEYFVTDVESDIETGSGNSDNVQSVDVTLTPFFSGVALDVIPQISDNDSVIMHIHPAISEVKEEIKRISITTDEELSIPLALSTIRETDSVIRAENGQVIILGGLMKNVTREDESRTPLLGDIPGVGNMFRHRRDVSAKSELVILLRPMVINSNQQWNGQLKETAGRFNDLRSMNNTAR